MIRKFLRVFIGIFLISPFLIILGVVDQWQWPDTSEVFGVFGFTAWQAFLSACFSVLVGVLVSISLVRWLNHKHFQILEILYILPNLMPQIFIILAYLQFSQATGLPREGLFPIVIIHSILNVGLVAVYFARVIASRCSGVIELCLVEGASFLRIFYSILKMLKYELGLIFVFVFCVCFTSFGVPLLVGGIEAITLEVLIYEKINIGGRWGEAFSISILQSLFLLIFAALLSRQKAVPLQTKFWNRLKVGPNWLGFVPVGLTLSLFVAQTIGLLPGLKQVMGNPFLQEELHRLILMSLSVGVLVGLLCFILLSVIAMALPHRPLESFLSGFISPSPVICGFALLVIPTEGLFLQILKLIGGLSLLYLPILFKLSGASSLKSLEMQIITARTMGAEWIQIFKRIVFPQVAGSFWIVSGLAAFWAMGDFAFSSLVADRPYTLGLIIKSMIESYRIEAAGVLVWILLFCGAILLSFFGGLAHVCSQKTSS